MSHRAMLLLKQISQWTS